ncbi:MAG: hypothetical protein QM791_04210 [Ferruginibacter sp.]
MEQNEIMQELEAAVKAHEKTARTHFTGSLTDRLNSLVNHYRHDTANMVAKRKELIENTLVYFRSVAMISESIGMAGTHAEKSARLRGLIELINSAISKLRKEQEEDILSNWNFFSWDHATYPYLRVLEKFNELKQQNEWLRKNLKEGVKIDDLPF